MRAGHNSNFLNCSSYYDLNDVDSCGAGSKDVGSIGAGSANIGLADGSVHDLRHDLVHDFVRDFVRDFERDFVHDLANDLVHDWANDLVNVGLVVVLKHLDWHFGLLDSGFSDFG